MPFSFLSFSFLIGWEFYGPNYLRWQRPFSPSVPAEAGCLFTVAAGVHLRGEPTLFPGWLVYK